MELKKETLKALERKLAEYSRKNGGIALHESLNQNGICSPGCTTSCKANSVAIVR